MDASISALYDGFYLCLFAIKTNTKKYRWTNHIHSCLVIRLIRSEIRTRLSIQTVYTLLENIHNRHLPNLQHVITTSSLEVILPLACHNSRCCFTAPGTLASLLCFIYEKAILKQIYVHCTFYSCSFPSCRLVGRK